MPELLAYNQKTAYNVRIKSQTESRVNCHRIGRMGMTNMNHILLKITRRLSVIFTILGLLVLSIGICIGSMIGLILIVAGLLILVGTIIFVAVFARCPYCGGFMKVGFHNYHCPHCGKYVNYNDD